MEYFKRTTDDAIFEKFVKENDTIDFIRHIWVDFAGILRQRILTKNHCLRLQADKSRYKIGPACMQYGVSDTFPETPKQVAFSLIPDWTSLRVCQFSQGHAWVMCFVYCEEAEDPLYQCPRHLLAKVLTRSEDAGDLQFLVGFELEFLILDEALQGLEGLGRIEFWSAIVGLRDKKLEFVEDVVRMLQRSDIEVSHFHTEERYKIEISTYPFRPMQAVDNLMYSFELLRCVGIKHGYRATVATKPLATPPTTPIGTHFSISETNETAKHFLAGILRKLPLIAPFASPTYDSYRRDTVDRRGTWISWGTENRDTPIRAIAPNHWELRIADATANFYMLISVLLSIGLDGIKDKEPLIWQDLRYPPSAMAKEDLAKVGVTERLPNTVFSTMAILRDRNDLDELLGHEMKRMYLATRERDEEAVTMMDDEERRRLFLRYF